MIHALDGIAPQIDPTAWIAPGAHVIGKVRIGAGASVWFGAVIRGDNEWIEIGAETNIQENAVLHTDMGYPLTVGARCTIGHKVMLHGCSIADEALVGMSATVLNGARIGRHALVGAGALVTEGKDIPEGFLTVGAPARPVRPLSPAQIEGLRLSAAHYAENARRFATGLKPLG
jgi:carbonic anhydrase/acetyltransferase-like protein (isoleucine patch superfamily)